MTLGTKLYNLRSKKNFSLEELAYKLNVSKTAIAKWESDSSKPSVENLLKICDFYDTDIYSLLESVSNFTVSNNKFRDGNYVAHTNNITVHNATDSQIIQVILENQNKITTLVEKQNDFISTFLKQK